jgi:hypothetical protein
MSEIKPLSELPDPDVYPDYSKHSSIEINSPGPAQISLVPWPGGLVICTQRLVDGVIYTARMALSHEAVAALFHLLQATNVAPLNSVVRWTECNFNYREGEESHDEPT